MRIPRFLITHPGIEGSQEFSHGRSERDCERLADVDQVLMERSQRPFAGAHPRECGPVRELRITERPPQMVRLPLKGPLSRLSGANPIRAAICLRFRRPGSGSSANEVIAVTSPTPGAVLSKSALTGVNYSDRSATIRMAGRRSY